MQCQCEQQGDVFSPFLWNKVETIWRKLPYYSFECKYPPWMTKRAHNFIEPLSFGYNFFCFHVLSAPWSRDSGNSRQIQYKKKITIDTLHGSTDNMLCCNIINSSCSCCRPKHSVCNPTTIQRLKQGDDNATLIPCMSNLLVQQTLSIMFDHTPFLCCVLLFSFILCVSSHLFVNSCDRLTERLHMASCKMTIMDAQLQGWHFLLRSIITLTLQRTVLPFKDHWVLVPVTDDVPLQSVSHIYTGTLSHILLAPFSLSICSLGSVSVQKSSFLFSSKLYYPQYHDAEKSCSFNEFWHTKGISSRQAKLTADCGVSISIPCNFIASLNLPLTAPTHRKKQSKKFLSRMCTVT